MSPLLPVALSALYGFMAWRMLRQPAASHPDWLRFLLPGVLLAHGWALAESLFGAGDIRMGLGNSLSTIAWLTALIYWLVSHGAPLLRIQAWVNVLAAGALLLMAVFSATHTIPNSNQLALRVHLAVAFLAYGLLAVAALHAGLMTVLEKRLHQGRAMEGGTPPLLTLEAVLFKTIAAGFVLLTLTVVSGILFSEVLFGQPLQFTHKVIFAILSWAVFGGLLLGRHFRGWRGRTALIWTMTGFILLVLAYIGTQFVLEVLLRR
ncbi:MAG: cytochrome c biogenesis protein CcsA [Thiobacillus sp.]